MKKIIIIIFLAIVFIIVLLFMINNKSNVTMQIIKYNTQEQNFKIVAQKNIFVNKGISMREYNGNDIKILEINDNYVKISSFVTKYDNNYKPYQEKLIQYVRYGQEINIDSNRFNPFDGVSLFNYYIKFTKEN